MHSLTKIFLLAAICVTLTVSTTDIRVEQTATKPVVAIVTENSLNPTTTTSTTTTTTESAATTTTTARPKDIKREKRQLGGLVTNLGQLPIIGTVVGQVPGLVGGLGGIPNQLGSTVGGVVGNLGNIIGLTGSGGLGNLGSLGNLLNLGGLGNLGQIGNLGGLLGTVNPIGNLGGLLGQNGPIGNLGQLGNLGGLLGTGGNVNPVQHNPSAGGGSSAAATCPLTQKLTCRCEPLLLARNLEKVKKTPGLQIVKQNIKRNNDGSQEISAQLSNGLHIYQKSNENLFINEEDRGTQGYYSLKLTEERYLTIYFTVNAVTYTVEADITTAPPRNELDEAQHTIVNLLDLENKNIT